MVMTGIEPKTFWKRHAM